MSEEIKIGDSQQIKCSSFIKISEFAAIKGLVINKETRKQFDLARREYYKNLRAFDLAKSELLAKSEFYTDILKALDNEHELVAHQKADSQKTMEDSFSVLAPFSTIEGRDWMAERVLDEEKVNFYPPLILLGDGPFEVEELGRFLNRYEVAVKLKDTYPREAPNEAEGWGVFSSIHEPIVVIGREKFQSKAFLSLLLPSGMRDRPSNFPSSLQYWVERIEGSNGESCYLRSKNLESVKFISQEMLLAEIFTKGNGSLSFSLGWNKHIEEHPGLKALREIRDEIPALDHYFAWPSTSAEPGKGDFDLGDWPKIGMLKFLGYSVGVNGKMKSNRQKILRDLFQMLQLPKVDNQSYVDAWGSSESSARLKKMAHSIAAFCRAARRRDEDAMSVAIDEWEEDLAWLKTSYYVGKFDRQFQWPETTDR